MEIALTEAAARYLSRLAQTAAEAQACYKLALKGVCLQQEGLPENYTVKPDWPGRVLRVVTDD